jgi:transcriptional regulator with XRE-family HTH domain
METRTLAELRREKGFTQKELAELVGVSEGTVPRWEANRNSPGENSLFALAGVLQIPQADLIKIIRNGKRRTETPIGKAIREKRGDLSQQRLANLLGVKQKTVSEWERGMFSPGLKNRRVIEIVLGIPFNEKVETKAPPQASKTLKQIRLEMGITQVEFAELLGVKLLSVSRWERGINCPRFQDMINIENKLGISIDELQHQIGEC